MVQFKGGQKENRNDISTFSPDLGFSSSLEMEKDVSSQINATDEHKLREKETIEEPKKKSKLQKWESKEFIVYRPGSKFTKLLNDKS